MKKRKTLDKLQELRTWKELEQGFPDKRSCLNWAAKVQPLLSFNISHQIGFNVQLKTFHRLVSAHTSEPVLQAMITILDTGIEQLKHEIDLEAPVDKVKLASPGGDYVHQSRIKELEAIKSKKFNLVKLIRFCNELNSSLRDGNLFSIIMLCRAIIDHVPPVFGVKSFKEVTNNYAGTKSFRESMERLNNSSRKIADQHLHTQIRNSEVLPTINQVDFSPDLDLLFSEVVRILSREP